MKLIVDNSDGGRVDVLYRFNLKYFQLPTGSPVG